MSSTRLSPLLKLLRTLALIAAVLTVPVLPFLALGGVADHYIQQWMQQTFSSTTTAAIVVGLLSTDVLLPIPSSVVSTFAGARLGPCVGTAAVWLGMTLGAVVGYAVARRWGYPLAIRIAGEQQLDRLQSAAARWGPGVLVATRALPVLAEASVLLMGLHRLSWWKFFAPVGLANLGIAIGYSALGHLARQNHWLPAALGISVAVPFAVGALVWRWLPADKVERDAS